MESYGDLLELVLSEFYNKKIEFPQDLLYPILKRNETNDVCDMFMICDLIRNIDGSIYKIENPSCFYLYNMRTQKSFFMDDVNVSTSDYFINTDIKFEISITDFTMIYMKAREFAFDELLTESQLDVLRKLVYIYDNLFEEKVSSIYHMYGSDFFEWAYRLLES